MTPLRKSCAEVWDNGAAAIFDALAPVTVTRMGQPGPFAGLEP